MTEPLVFLLALGTAMAIWPGRFAGPFDRARARRLEEIGAGARERYFEEHRALIEYRPTPRFLQLWRIIGLVIAMTAVSQFVDERFDVVAPPPPRIQFSAS